MVNQNAGTLEGNRSFSASTNLEAFSDRSTKAAAIASSSPLDSLSLPYAITSSSSSINALEASTGDTSAHSGSTPSPALASSLPAPSSGGLLAQYYDGTDLTNLKQTRTDATVNFNWGFGSPDSSIGVDNFSARWSGQIQAAYSETYTFYTRSDDGVRLWVNGQLLIDHWADHGTAEDSGTIALTAGQSTDIRLEYYEDSGEATAQLLWSSLSQSKEVVSQNYLSSASNTFRASATGGETAKSAYSFIDSIGVNTHLHYYDTAYGNFPLIEQRLLELGVHHIRDGGSDLDWIQRLTELAGFGIKSTLVIDPNIGIGPNTSYAIQPPGYDVHQFVKDVVPSSVEAIEILNEFDISHYNGYSYNSQAVTDANWVTYLRNFTRDTFNAINSDPATQDVAVIGPSFVYGNSSTAIGDLSQWVDYGNLHPYNYPNYPGNGNLTQEIANRSSPFGNHPLIATETGYPTGNLQSDRPVSETVQGKYMPRLFLENFNQGIYRTFSYELIDQWNMPSSSEASFGLLHSDGTPKPAFTALQNLISVLNDTGASFTPGSLDYLLSGNIQNVHHTFLQKSNGDFYLVMWLEVPSTDAATSQSVTLSVNTHLQQATTYLPNQSANPVEQYTNPTQLTLNVTDSPLVVQLSPTRPVV